MPRMRTWLVMAVTAGLLAVGCSRESSSDETTPTTAGLAPASSAASTTHAPSTTVAPAAVVPVVICSGFGATYFGYTNSGSAPVVIPAGADNIVEGGDEGDEPLVPTVFAPGQFGPAFWVSTVESDDGTVSWTLAGPDGQRRQATSGPSDPECDDEEIAPPVADPRSPQLAYAYSVGTDAVTIVATAIGTGTESVCPEGLEPRPPRVWIETTDSSGTTVSVGPTTQVVAPLQPATDPVTNRPAQGAVLDFILGVADVCAAGVATTLSWPVGHQFDDLINGERVRVRVLPQPAGWIPSFPLGILYNPVSLTVGPTTELPATGGVRQRSSPPAG
jgi:hypothetical protein